MLGWAAEIDTAALHVAAHEKQTTRSIGGAVAMQYHGMRRIEKQRVPLASCRRPGNDVTQGLWGTLASPPVWPAYLSGPLFNLLTDTRLTHTSSFP